MKRIIFFGIYDPEYARNRILARGFEENGWEVTHCRVDPKIHRGMLKYVLLIRERYTLKNKSDVVLVAFPAQTVSLLARLLLPRQTIICDMFTSLYDSNVFDRKLYASRSLRGLKDYFLDWHALRLVDHIIADTNQHVRYLNYTFNFKKEIIRVCVGSVRSVLPVGSSSAFIDSSHTVDQHTTNKFIVFFVGYFIPLQGIEYIVRGAKLLESDTSIIFKIVGKGQEYARIKKLSSGLAIKNIEFIDPLPYTELINETDRAHLVLGIFGITHKSARVIPNKVYDGLAAGKAIITADTPAVRELLTDKENVLLYKAGDPCDLADKIMLLKKDPVLRARLEKNALTLHQSKLTPKVLVSSLLDQIEI